MEFPKTSKQDRAKYRELIHRALERESKDFVDRIQALSSKPVSEEKEYKEKDGFAQAGPNTIRYKEIYSAVKEYDKYVFKRYDGPNTVGYNFDRVFNLYRDGVLTDADINELSPVEVSRLKARKNLLDEISNQ